MSKNGENVYKSVDEIKIPIQLAKIEGARFIKISKNDGSKKKPKEKGFLIDKNYPADDAGLMGHIKGGGNYGIATGFGDLQCFDADNLDRLKELGIIAKLPKTFEVRTGRESPEGRHFWFIIKGLQKRIVLYDPERTKEGTTEPLHLGEIQSKGNFAIGPGSIHKSGRRYEIINDYDVAELSYEDLMEIIKPLKLSKKEKETKERKKSADSEKYEEIDISKIGWPRGEVKKTRTERGIEYQGTHPFHDSTTGANFSINQSKGVWYCFRHDSGGGWKELLAVREGIISCKDAGPGCLTKQQYRDVMQRATELGLLEERSIEAPIAKIELEREELKEIPREVPEGNAIALIAPPRTGKTHRVVLWMKDTGNGNYITHTHAIVEHAVKIAKEAGITGGVWLVGIKQPGACRQRNGIGECATCRMKISKESFYSIEKAGLRIMNECGILTAADIPEDLCPYNTLKLAEKSARFCFTVVNNINDIQPRDITILDEEPVLSHFYAGSIEVARIRASAGELSYRNFLKKNQRLMKEIDQILNKGKRKSLKEYAMKIHDLTRIIEMGIDEQKDAEELAEEIRASLEDFDPKHREVREEGERGEDGEFGLEDCIRCLGNLYRERPVTVMSRPGGYRSIYILGDERSTSYAMKWASETKKIIVIGATRAEMFVKELGGREIVIPTFRYDNRFRIYGIDGETRIKQQKRIMEIASELKRERNKNSRTPFILLTGSKKKQEMISKIIGGTTMAREEREDDMEKEFITGKPVIIYQNSIISRGLDVDQYNLMLVNDCEFAQPFWGTADKSVAEAIISDETTNAVLRISSNLRRDKETLKIIVMRKDDMRRVKYVSDRIVFDKDIEILVKALKDAVVSGRVEFRSGGCDVMKSGIKHNDGKIKMDVYTSRYKTSEDIVESNLLKIVERKILDLLRINYMKTRKGITTKGIKSQLEGKYGKPAVGAALESLLYKGRIARIEQNHGTRWAIRTKECVLDSDTKNRRLIEDEGDSV